MGSVFRKTFTKPLPAGAETFVRKGERLARWKDRRGKTRTAPLTAGKNGSERIIIESLYYVAKYRDGTGVVQTVATGCRDETAARQVLAELSRRAELIKAKVMTAGEDAVARHQTVPLVEHFDAFDEHLRAKDTSSIYREYTRNYLDRLAAECPFSTLADMCREMLERWLAAQAAEGMSAKARNHYRGALVAFCNWCLLTNRLTVNPFAEIPKANEKADRRRLRRAMDEDELLRLLNMARQRPLLDAATVRRGRRRGEAYANLREETRNRLLLLGRERALIYKTLVLTGLRKGELVSLTVAQMFLDGPVPYIALDAAEEKNRQGSEIVLREDLAEDLRQWLADKLERLRDEARGLGVPIPVTLPADTPLFTVPAGLLRILNRDLRLAGIPKRDERGRTLDIHALRTTFGTLLSKGGVAPRTAQAAMRHSDIRLTMGVYTDPKLLDVRGALDALPALPLNDGSTAISQVVRATGTDDLPTSSLAPTLALTSDNSSIIQSIPGKMAAPKPERNEQPPQGVSGEIVKRKDSLTTAVNEPQESGRLDLNQRPHGPEPCALAKLSYAPWSPYRSRIGLPIKNTAFSAAFHLPAGHKQTKSNSKANQQDNRIVTRAGPNDQPSW
jgi:integrase